MAVGLLLFLLYTGTLTIRKVGRTMPTFIKKMLSDKTLAITTILSIIALVFGQVAWTDINVHTIVALAALLLLVGVYERTRVWLPSRRRLSKRAIRHAKSS